MLDSILNRIVFRRLLITLLICATTVPVNALGSASKNNEGNARRGAQLWTDTCGSCHNLRSPDEFRPDQLRAVMAHMRIRAGLTGQDYRDILVFLIGENIAKRKSEAKRNGEIRRERLRKVTKNNTDDTFDTPKEQTTITRRSGKAIYRKTCAVCHGVNGKGVIPTAQDMTKPNSPLSKPFSTLLRNIENGVGAMPAKGGDASLTREELRAVLNYMISAFKPSN